MQPDTFSPVLFKVPRWQMWFETAMGLCFFGLGISSLRLGADHHSSLGFESWYGVCWLAIALLNFLQALSLFRFRNLTLYLDETGFTYTDLSLTTRYAWKDVSNFRYGRMLRFWPKSWSFWIYFSLRNPDQALENDPKRHRILNKFSVSTSQILTALERRQAQANSGQDQMAGTSSMA